MCKIWAENIKKDFNPSAIFAVAVKGLIHSFIVVKYSYTAFTKLGTKTHNNILINDIENCP